MYRLLGCFFCVFLFVIYAEICYSVSTLLRESASAFTGNICAAGFRPISCRRRDFILYSVPKIPGIFHRTAI